MAAICMFFLSSSVFAAGADHVQPSQIWIETNGLGSVISGTAGLSNTSKYHALFVSLDAQGNRITFVNNLEASVDDGVGHQTWLSSNLYAGNNGDVTHPDGANHVVRFTPSPWPTWEFAVSDGSSQGAVITREVLFVQGSDRAIVRYQYKKGANPVHLVLRPLLSGRSYFDVRKNYDGLGANNLAVGKGVATVRLGNGIPEFHMYFGSDSSTAASWGGGMSTYWNQTYPLTRERQEDATEHLWSPGEIATTLAPGNAAWIVMESGPARSAPSSSDIDRILRQENAKRDSVAHAIATEDSRLQQLAVASENFLFTRPDGKRSILAGFPWFLDWGRDSFISMEGLLLVKGRVAEAHDILKNFASYEKNGLLPNMFPNLGTQPVYNSVDAPLWFAVMAARTLNYGNSETAVIRDLFPALRNILNAYVNGTSFNIKADSNDGLVWAGAPGVQLTWMDAKVGDYVVTPRRGKPVEINALWYAALDAGIRLGRKAPSNLVDSQTLQKWERYRTLVQTNFERRYYDSARGMLRDVVDGDDPEDANRLRPNGLYALALAPGLINRQNAETALGTIEEKLLTPMGLRTLSPDDSGYRGRYEGDINARDGAYHQGTAWPFLLGAYADAVLNVRGSGASDPVWQSLQAILNHAVGDAFGHASEIFDGDAPQLPRGCYAQAWSDAELVRIATKLGKLRFTK